ncbi:MAG TPA: hypothetical protein EYH54_03640 [Nautiliaceae bacterium]|nr:hypothetical protein [Nautiliaceae bacterium]
MKELSLKNKDIRFFNSFFEKLIGVMFMKKNEKVFIFKQKKSKNIVHTFFCDPIYIYFFNENFELVEKVYLRSFRFYFTKKPFVYMIESFEDLGLMEGDKIILDF